MNKTTRKLVRKFGPNITGKQNKDHKTSPVSVGTNAHNPLTKQASHNKVATAFVRYLTTK